MDFDIKNAAAAIRSGEMKPAEVASQMQAMFMEELIKSMEETVHAEGGLYGDSSSSDIYRGMLREQLATAMSSDLDSPLRDQLEKAIQDRIDSTPAPTPTPIRGLEPRTSETLPVAGPITSRVGWRSDPLTGERRFHGGTDIAAPAGTPIQAVANGRVVESGPKGGYGNAIVIETDDGRNMLYAHNSENHVKVGDKVRQGQTIGLVGSTGRSTGAHVHFEVSE